VAQALQLQRSAELSLQGDVIIAIRASEGPPPVESVKMACTECGEDCWVSRGTRAGAPAGATVKCTLCMLALLKGERGP
jgi:hypothetical protein